MWALQLGLLTSREFAAVAVHAGLIPEGARPLVDQAKRKTPISIQVGSRDPFFTVDKVSLTVKRLKGAGFDPEFLVIPGHDHDYYSNAKSINSRAWEFLRQHNLSN